MKKRQYYLLVFWVLISVLIGPMVYASEQDELARLLDEFLAGASIGSVQAHERFWANDLVYTSSSGTRTNKLEIIEGARAAGEQRDAEGDEEEPSVIYSAEDVDIRLYGDTAIVAFRLIGTPHSADIDIMQYFNTGTFLKRDGDWRVVAWQATKIPEPKPEP